MEVAKEASVAKYTGETKVIDYENFAKWSQAHPNARPQYNGRKKLIDEMIGCHSDNTKFCGKCIKDMEQRLIAVFENKYAGYSSGYDIQTNTRDVLRFMYRLVGETENVDNGQMFLYQKWNECIVYDISHEPVFDKDEPVYRKDKNGKRIIPTYQEYVTDVYGTRHDAYIYADQGYWLFNVNPRAKGLNTPKILQVNP